MLGLYLAELVNAGADASGATEERDQNGKRIEAVAQHREQAELPDDRRQRAADGEPGQFPFATIEIDGEDGEDERAAEEYGRRFDAAFGDVGDVLGEADDVDLEI